MPAFHFRLSSLERLRRQAREQCQRRLAEAEAAATAVEEQRAVVAARLAGLQNGMRASIAPGPIDLACLSASGQSVEPLRNQLAALGERHAALVAEAALRRGDLLTADQELKTLEKLRQRQHEQHQAAKRRGDQKALDDVAAVLKPGESRLGPS